MFLWDVYVGRFSDFIEGWLGWFVACLRFLSGSFGLTLGWFRRSKDGEGQGPGWGGSRGPREQGDQRTKGPADQRTREPQDQRNLKLFFQQLYIFPRILDLFLET